MKVSGEYGDISAQLLNHRKNDFLKYLMAMVLMIFRTSMKLDCFRELRLIMVSVPKEKEGKTF